MVCQCNWSTNNYGKSRVRLMKVARRGDWHELQNITVKIAFEGDFDDIHIEGDNSKCLPTDTMKNTVYALAAQTDEIEEIESFGLRLARYFLAENEQVSRVSIDIIEHKYTRITTGGEPHPHSFTKNDGEKRTTCSSDDTRRHVDRIRARRSDRDKDD